VPEAERAMQMLAVYLQSNAWYIIMTEIDGIARSSDVVTYFKRYPYLMFATACEREVLRFLRKRGGILSKKATEQVCT
jgi:hypothetical protein